MNKIETIQIRCTPIMKKAIEDLAKKKQMTMSELIEWSLYKANQELFDEESK